MISAWLAQRAAAAPDRILLSWPGGRHTYRECLGLAGDLRRAHASRGDRPAGIESTSDVAFFLSLLALDGMARRVFLLPQDAGAPLVMQLAERHRFDLFDASREEPQPKGGEAPAPVETEVVLFTSGTSGTPKAALHGWASIAASIHTGEKLDGSRWLLTYSPTSYAGLQVFLHALLNGGQLSFGPSRAGELADLALRDQVTHVSGTPTFYRLLLSTARPETLAGLRWTQITLGGEPVDQHILDALRRRFPDAQITHVYASTEAGVGFSVQDGRAGFPARYLDTLGGDVGLRIVDGELQLRSRGAMRRYLDEPDPPREDAWLASGDLVQVDGDRVHFLGRNSDRINVGGSKLSPVEVEEVLRGIEGIRDARVYGTPNPLTGQIVCADIVLAPEADAVEMRPRILAACRARLPAFKVPRILHFVDRLATTAAGKLVRG
ncbi:MAG TPA: class I adenylate-forming enzyme family protein [Candidatus Eisenbacteria bacterium]|nr:class I adenylate-forming enzyme family protein [Candidatus Eisenbacteria bacterium]